LHYSRLGYAVVGSMVVAILLMYMIDRHIKQKDAAKAMMSAASAVDEVVVAD
jgi:hypothetical protein